MFLFDCRAGAAGLDSPSALGTVLYYVFWKLNSSQCSWLWFICRAQWVLPVSSGDWASHQGAARPCKLEWCSEEEHETLGLDCLTLGGLVGWGRVHFVPLASSQIWVLIALTLYWHFWLKIRDWLYIHSWLWLSWHLIGNSTGDHCVSDWASHLHFRCSADYSLMASFCIFWLALSPKAFWILELYCPIHLYYSCGAVMPFDSDC